jgi:hypothetical protein
VPPSTEKVSSLLKKSGDSEVDNDWKAAGHFIGLIIMVGA